MNRILAAVAAFILVGVSVPAMAQVDTARIGYEAPTLRADSYSLLNNPANLSLLDGFHSALQWSSSYENSDEDQDFSWLTALGTAGGFGAGFGVQSIERQQRYFVTSIGISGGTDRFSVGFVRHGFHSQVNRTIDNYSTSDLAFTLRANNYVAFSTVIRNLTTPHLGPVDVPRNYLTGFGLRSANDEFGLDLFYAGDEGDYREFDAVFGATVAVRPTDGLRLFADVRFDSIGDDVDFVSAGGGLEVAFGPGIASYSIEVADRTDGTELFGIASAEIRMPFLPQLFNSRGTLLRIDLAGDPSESPGVGFFGSGDAFVDTLMTLRRLAREDEMAGVYLHMDGVAMGPAQAFEMRQALEAVRDSGKIVIVYMTRGNFRELYLAGSADYVIASPSANVIGTGIGITRMYLADFLDNVGLEAQFVRIGAYKSSPERFINSGPSPESQERIDAYLDAVYAEFIDGIAAGADADRETVEMALAEPPLTLPDMQSLGLVDATAFEDEVSDLLAEDLGERYTVSRIYGGFPEAERRWFDTPSIAVLHIDGGITSGMSGVGFLTGGVSTGAATVEAFAEAIRNDPSVAGVIVRVDSPGGSAIASDEMHHALTRLAAVVPTRVSMGDVAASGGYYVSALGVPVHATPVTLTGSIGIYAGTVSVDELAGILGINRTRDERGERSDYFDGFRWSSDDSETMFDSITAMYELFLSRVSEGREMPTDEIDAIAQGRTWTGTEAVDIGLVDQIDGFVAAYDAMLADLDIRGGRQLPLRHYGGISGLSLDVIGFAAERLRIGGGRATAPSMNPLAAVVDRLGMSGLAASMEPFFSEPFGSPMAHLEWWVELD